jgi:dual specificity protein kinase CLK2/3
MSQRKLLRGVLGDASIMPTSLEVDVVEVGETEIEQVEVEEEEGKQEEESPESLRTAQQVHDKLIITPERSSEIISSLLVRRVQQETTQHPRKRKRDTTSVHKKMPNYSHRSNSRSHSCSHSASRRSVNSDGSDLSSHADNDDVGHHCGTPGMKIKDRYELIREIGMGTFGKVFHCFDSKHKDTVAIKVVRSIKRYVDSAKIEADILDHVYDCQAKQNSNYCLKLYSHFELDKFYFLVTEKLGPSLYDVLKLNNYKGFPMSIIRHIARQLLQAMKFLKSMNLIHTDLKVENVLFVGDIPALLSGNDTANVSRGGEREREGGGHRSHSEVYPQSSLIKIIDFGGATYDNEKKSTVINTRQYRSPEVLLETKWSFPSDIWSVGCIIAEIYIGGLLFQTHGNLEHLALIERCCGLFPFRLLKDSRISRDYFDNRGKTKISQLSRDSQSHVRSIKRLRDVFALDKDHRDRSGIADLMKEMLEIDPGRRVTASQALQMSFVR